MFVCLLYRGGQLYWWRKPEYPEKTIDLSQVTDMLYHIMLYTSPWWRLELTTSVVIDTDCIDSYKSKYHTITATTAPREKGDNAYLKTDHERQLLTDYLFLKYRHASVSHRKKDGSFFKLNSYLWKICSSKITHSVNFLWITYFWFVIIQTWTAYETRNSCFVYL
jgi:hypothetical protein